MVEFISAHGICLANLISASPCFSTFFSAVSIYLAQRRPSSILVGEWSHGDRRRIAKLCRLTDQKHVENDFHRTVTIMQPQPHTQPSFFTSHLKTLRYSLRTRLRRRNCWYDQIGTVFSVFIDCVKYVFLTNNMGLPNQLYAKREKAWA